jgi:HlyD family secretion protein
MFSINRMVTLGAMLTGALLLTACALPQRPGDSASTAATDERITVSAGSVENRIVATGRVTARTETSVAFPRGGAVTRVLVKEGERVKKGQPLATLDTASLELTAQQQYANYLSAQAQYSQTLKGPTAAELAAAKAALADAQAGYSDLYKAPAESSLAALRAALQNAEVELRNAQFAYDNRFRQDPAGIGASQEAADLEKATNNYNKAKADYDAKFEKPSAAAIASASSQIQNAKKNLAALTPEAEAIKQQEAKMQQAWFAYEQARADIAHATIVAPYDGLVTEVNVAVGDWANAGMAAVHVADFTVPVFEVDVDEADLGGVKVGQTARVRLQTYRDTPIFAQVESISSVGSNTGSIVTYKVKLALGKSGGNAQTPAILINMSGTGEIVTAQANDALIVPNRALTIDSQTKSFSVQKLQADGTTKSVPVEVGYRDSDKAQILSGVSAGDTIVIPVKAVTQERAPAPIP